MNGAVLDNRFLNDAAALCHVLAATETVDGRINNSGLKRVAGIRISEDPTRDKSKVHSRSARAHVGQVYAGDLERVKRTAKRINDLLTELGA